jgi:hypothetical protein
VPTLVTANIDGSFTSRLKTYTRPPCWSSIYAEPVPMPTEVAGVVAELVVHDRQLTFRSA